MGKGPDNNKIWPQRCEYFLTGTFEVGAQKKCLIETVPFSTHNIHFGQEIRKLILITYSYL